jgi:hypothetical protein
MKEKLIEIKQKTLELNNLIYGFNASFHSEKIEFLEDFQIDEDGYNFCIVGIIPQENVIELSYDVFEEDEQIKCTEFISIEQFIKYVK